MHVKKIHKFLKSLLGPKFSRTLTLWLIDSLKH